MMEPQKDIFHDPSYRFHPALVLDSILPPRARSVAVLISGVVSLAALFLFLFLLLYGFDWTVFLKEWDIALAGDPLADMPTARAVPLGLFLLFSPIFLTLVLLGWFRNSYYYHVEALLERGVTGTQTAYTTPNYETNDIFLRTADGDLLKSFFTSPYGTLVALRSGLSHTDILAYLSSRTSIVDFRVAPGIDLVFTLRDIVKIIIAHDQDFASFVFGKGIRPEDLSAASEWVERDLKRRRRKSRTWGRVALGQVRGIGADLSYGIAYALKKYSIDLTRAVATGRVEFRHLYGAPVIGEMETILFGGNGGNIVLVGEESGALMDTIVDFTHDAANGFMHDRRLAASHVLVLDWKILLVEMKTKQEFELRMIKMMEGAIQAKNIIVVIEDYPGFMRSAQSLGSDVVSVLDPYTQSTKVRFLVTADMGQYHAFLEQNEVFRSRFGTLMVPQPEKSSLTRTLEDAAMQLEERNHVLFTYPAIRALREGAQRYFVDPVMPDTALKLMADLAPAARVRGDKTVGYDDVMNHIQAKTGVPVGTITAEERDKLEHLEDTLHLHVIGQHQAIKVIANALRRSRAGVRNPDRPIGTFLFLGPTGVGKTEVAKALARVFFGSESSMVRFDMSEFQSEDGLARLIGGPGVGAGALSNQLREHPYGVLLLDEFEKTHTKVLDLFLQVFDEGVFHDAHGKKVNAQNTIMIATSNAGAPLIREALKQGLSLESVEKEIIDGVIAEGTYKPELLNRFDAVVIFHPLTTEDYRKIATLMVEKLRRRLREKSIDITVNDALLDALLARGVDPDFGARPMNRAVQELLEQTIASKIISGEVRPGMTVTFRAEDFKT